MPDPSARYFEDFSPGDTFETAGVTVSRSQILDFALVYDPQPIHLDERAAESGPFGGLIASGFQTLGLGFRLAWDANVFNAANMGSPGLDELRWHKPVRPDDTLRTRLEVLETRTSRSKPDRGFVTMGYTVLNQNDEAVMTFKAIQIMRRRPA